jgi:glycosyltransferase involved in cell wall biosynthesis
MKIAILSSCQGYDWAGSEENWAWLAQAAMVAGHQVMLGADQRLARGSRVQAMKKNGLRVVERRPQRPMRLYLLKEKLWPDMRAMLDFNPDVLFLNAGSPLDFCQLPYLKQFCRRLTVPKMLVLTFNSELLAFPQRGAVGEFFSGLDGVVCVSEQTRQTLARQLAGKIPETRVIRNVSRLKLTEPLPYPSMEGEIRLASVARFDVLWKGHDLLLEVLAGAEWKDRPWVLNLYGKGPDEDYVRRLAAYYGLGQKVHFCGWVPEVRTMWEDNHLLILASRGEGLPLTAVEAMMCGRPVVLTPVGGNAEIIRHGETGFLADAANEPCLSRTLEEAWAERARWEAMGKRAHQDACALGLSDPGSEMLGFLEEIVTRQASRSF